MEIRLGSEAVKDLEYIKSIGNHKILKRIVLLIESIKNSPFKGIGKPEPLKHNWYGKWSRRIDRENRLIYEIGSDHIKIHSLLGHYK
ncbi:MAG TPA: Txe/YoeB family addiction module toxin [Saprospiraceae bacterium]|nr:Txe/YoeB family addiction module toxin [Saprospiraceae bacterium]